MRRRARNSRHLFVEEMSDAAETVATDRACYNDFVRIDRASK